MVELQVEGMTCGGCAAGVKRAVQALDKDAHVDVDLAGKTVRVGSRLDVEAIKEAVMLAGFPVTKGRTV